MTFVLAHLSDPHVGPLPVPRWRDLAGKRLTGYWNWHSSRHSIHDMDVLAAICDDIRAHQPDHVALTGDLVNIGLSAEFPLAHGLLAGLGDARAMSIVPGNHDAYVRGSLDAMMRAFAPWQTGDDGASGFPYLRRRGNLALIGVSSAVPTLPFMATGLVGAGQRGRLEKMLAACRREGLATVVMIHHPPHRGGARLARGLKDARAVERVLASHGADLVLHGHNHRLSVHRLAGPAGAIPVVGVASASAVPGDAVHRAAWHLYRLEARDGRLTRIDLEIRGMERPRGPVIALGHERLA